ncbi:MAG: PhoU domain-containing protein, partial [Luteolibacter sp.]
AYEVPRQVANVHMIVNVTTVLLLLPFTNLLAKLIVRVVGEGKPPEEATDVAPELNTVLLGMPPLAIDAAGRELLRLGERVGDLLDAAVPAILDGRDAEIDGLRADEDLIDRHHAAIVRFIEKVLHSERAPEISRDAMNLAEAADYLEAIADLVDREIIPLHQRHAESGRETDPQSRERLIALAEAVRNEFRRALQAVGEENRALATSVIDAKSQLRELERTVIDASLDDSLGLMRPSALERELAESLRRGYSLIRRFVRVGTGLHRAGMEGAAARDSLLS